MDQVTGLTNEGMMSNVGGVIKEEELKAYLDPVQAEEDFSKRNRETFLLNEVKVINDMDQVTGLTNEGMMSNVGGVIKEEELKAYVDPVQAEEGNVEEPASNNDEIVYFDLETTGLSTKISEICQISAIYDKQTPFNIYIKPICGIPDDVRQITGLSIYNGEMFLHENKIETTSLIIGLFRFLQFLKNIGKRVILVAHNGFRFDVQFLIRDIRSNGLWSKFEALVSGCADTLPILKEKLPERKQAKRKFNQMDLGIDLLGEDAVIGLHNAVNDVELLIKILEAAGVTPEEVKKNTKCLDTIIQEHDKAAQKAENKATMNYLKDFISDGMISKMAGAGITLNLLQRAYEEGEDAVVHLLSENIGGRPRVTRNKRILKNVMAVMAINKKYK